VNVRPVLLVIAALLLCAPVQAQERLRAPPAGAAQTKAPDTKTVPEKKEARKLAPMVFFIAKGEPDACGLGCSEWIAADGKIDGTTPGRLRALLARTRRKLPIYFSSPGGSVPAAIEIGRLMRAREMTAGVARTIPQGCDAGREREGACDALKQSGREVPAELRTLSASCNSACVYALIGAKVREVAADAGLGVHRISITRTTIRTYRNGKIEASSRLLPGDAPGMRTMNGQLARYAAEMGISGALIEAATAVPHEKLRFITRDEIARFGIDRREFDETRWIAHEGRPGAWSVVKTAVQAKAGEPKLYRRMQLVLLCGRAGSIGVGFAREVDSEMLASAAIESRGGEIKLSRARTQPKTSDNGVTMELWIAMTPKGFMENAASGETIELLETPSIAIVSMPPRRVTLSTLGLSPAIGVLGQQCR
jgi:hypothetical protein